jgi:hypothetical protein
LEDTLLNKTVTFAVDTKYQDRIRETFTFEELGIDENMDTEEVKKEIDKIFKAWVYDRLNISYSIVIETGKD